MGKAIKRSYKFGPFQLDGDERLLLRDGQPVAITPKAFDTLLFLVENSGHLVLKDELMKAVWPNTFVEEVNLSQNISVLRKALGDSTQQQQYIATVPGRGYRFAAKVEEITEGEPASAPALQVESHTRAQAPIEERKSWRKPLVAGLVLLLIAGVLGYRVLRHRQPKAPTLPVSAVKPRPAIAIVGFRNLSSRPDQAWLSTALSEMFATELAAGGQLRMISGEQVARTMLELGMSGPDNLDTASVARLHSELGADYIVLGGYTTLRSGGRERIRLDFRLQDASDGEIIAEDAVTGSRDELFDLVSRAGQRLRGHLAVGQISNEQSGQLFASLPANEGAARYYAEGLAKLRVYESRQARDLLLKATVADPKFPLAHFALASAWFALGYEGKAQQEAGRALELSAKLSQEQRLLVEGQYRQMNNEVAKAVDIYRTLFDLFPDNLDYGLRLASAQVSSGDPKGADVTLETLRSLPPPLGPDPRIDLAERRAAHELGDFKRAQQLAVRAAQTGKAHGEPLIVAEGRLGEGLALERLGQLDQAIAALQESRTAFAAAGDLKGAANALVWNGNTLYDKGDFENARRNFEEALLIYRQIGNQGNAARALNNLGNVSYDQGKLAEAKSYYEQALRIDRETGYKAAIGDELGNIANVLDGLGDLAGAMKMHTQALQIFQEVGDKRATASTFTNLGTVRLETGDLPGAAQEYEKAFQLHSQTGYRRGMAYALLGLGDVLAAEDKLTDARDKYEQSLAIRIALGEKANSALTRARLAILSLEQNRPADAESLALQAKHDLEDAKAPEMAASTEAALARALLAEGKLADAQTAVNRALALSDKSPDRTARFAVALAAARVEAVSGKFAAAQQRLTRALTETRKFGYSLYEFECRLALAEIALRSHSANAAARAQLKLLADQARAKGFALIARKAAAAAS